MRTRWMLAMVAAVALFAAACGGDSDGDDAAPETTAVATDEGGDAGEDTTATTAAAPDGTSAPKEDIEVSGDPNSEWCQLASTVQTQLDGVEADPFSFFSEAGLTQLTSALDQAVQVAPPEIRSDVAASRDAFAELGALFAEYDFDILSVPPAELEAAVDQDAVSAAGDRIQAYNEQVCGIESDVATAPGTAPSLGDSEAAVEAFVQGLTSTLPITEDQARCLAEELDFASLAADGSFDPNDPELLDQVFGVLGVCDISITDLAG